jgi:hypothetical protein
MSTRKPREDRQSALKDPTVGAKDTIDLLGIREIFKLTARRLRSQALLFAFVTMLLLFVAYEVVGNQPLPDPTTACLEGSVKSLP